MPKWQQYPNLLSFCLQAVDEPGMNLLDQFIIKKGKEARTHLAASDAVLGPALSKHHPLSLGVALSPKALSWREGSNELAAPSPHPGLCPVLEGDVAAEQCWGGGRVMGTGQHQDCPAPVMVNSHLPLGLGRR